MVTPENNERNVSWRRSERGLLGGCVKDCQKSLFFLEYSHNLPFDQQRAMATRGKSFKTFLNDKNINSMDNVAGDKICRCVGTS